MNIEAQLQQAAVDAIKAQYAADIAADQIQVQNTRKDFEGDFTLVVFPLLRTSKKSPEQTGTDLGEWMVANIDIVDRFNVVKGFLNIVLSDALWLSILQEAASQPRYGFAKPSGKSVMLEYSSPNTNKPLHLGHIRNNLLGWSCARILEANGHEVTKVQVINDRGIHICKSMLAWKLFADGETPQSSGIKGDHLVGKYYVRFDKEQRDQAWQLVQQWAKNDFAEAPDEKIAAHCRELIGPVAEAKSLYDQAVKEALDAAEIAKRLKTHKNLRKKLVEPAKPFAPILAQAQEMLRQWEAGDKETVELWRTMNSWVYAGFETTYANMGVSFDKMYYESETYLVGRDQVLKGLEKGVFERHEDNSVWCDLTDEGLDNKLVLRSDGTAVYMTQDIGTAILRAEDYPAVKRFIYTVGREQDYHFKVLFRVLKKLGYDWWDQCYHLSYGMVNLTTGVMKSREGTVVDADDLMAELANDARAEAEQHESTRAKLADLTEDELKELYHTIGMGALKYFILKVDPVKTMIFDPLESIKLKGNTGPFIQYAYARIQSLLREVGEGMDLEVAGAVELSEAEHDIIGQLYGYGAIITQAGEEMNPGILANYVYDLAQLFNQFFQNMDVRIKDETDEARKAARLTLALVTGRVIESGMDLLGIKVPERM